MAGGDPKKVAEVEDLCLRRGWRVGLAESCTGGLLSAWLTETPGISKVYQGAIVSYARSTKIDLLNVKESMIQSHGEVSVAVAKAMAQGAKLALKADWTVAITGIAGPSGGTPEKPVGTVCFGVVGPGFEQSLRHQFPSHLERYEIQRHAALFALDLLLSAMR